ncbi:ATP-dependent Clp protease ATP-binding subunit CLPT1, chloroplastic-like [Asparagus officinalis]|uniref:ATP-dependent Clp protease ATP-binding subunit CLPT1, chloroplastic-like n=1 Tax=Asparagus officinalis TaxID=4686 RepID=UPI00098E38E4|nr:ATP-dependent Clp protease ATP-binding subunit CLPT1, chloroplastic-like [Asparagus officinalis]
MAAACALSLSPIPVPFSSLYSSNSKKRISSSVFFQTPKSSFLGFHALFSLQTINSPSPKQTLRKLSSTVLFMLPTAKPDRAPAEKIPKWSARSIKSFGMGELEARKLKYPTTGTEALLMGILVEGTSEAAKFLRANGITLFKVRDETVKLLGKSDMYFFSPEHPPLTEPAQRALDWAVDEKMKSGEDGEVTTSHMLLGIWSEKDSAGHKILATLGFDDAKASELAKNANKEVAMNYR